MLRITLHHDDTQCRLELAGKLGGPEVAETETAWRSNTCPGKRIEVDLREVTSVDDAGRKLLEAMHSAGANFIVKGVWMTALIEEIIGEQLSHRENGTERRLRRDDKGWNRREKK